MKAFPTPAFSVNDEARITSIGGEGGMDLRDYFAAKAMQGMFASGSLSESVQDDELAAVAYVVADAMLKARKA
jgi:hypothetical protein